MDEECELRELVAKTLENSGTLAKLRAQLRASVFLALEGQDFCKAFVNKPLQEFVSTTEGALITCLVREFLECFGLDVTLSVFDPETSVGKDYELCGRKSLCQQLGLNIANDTGSQKPLLAHLLKLDQTLSKLNDVPQKDDGMCITFQKNVCVSDTKKISVPASNVVENEKAYKDRETLLKPRETVPSWAEENGLTSSFGAFSKVNKQPLERSKFDENMQLQKPSIGSSAAALNDLPPILGFNANHSQASHLSVMNSESDLELKAMIDMGLDYEEDFNSSGSGQEKSPKSLPATESEIEEEMDDIDEVSNISAGEDFAADKSLSSLLK